MTRREAIIYLDPEADPSERLDLGTVRTAIVPAADAAAAARAAARLVDEGVDEVQLCGATGPTWTAKVIEAVGDRARVGTVLFGMESLTSVAQFKARSEAGEKPPEAFILRQDGADPSIDRVEKGRRTYVLVPDGAAAARVAAELSRRPGGLQLIELYGGFDPGETAIVIEATGGGRVPVGAVSYGPG
jgi:Family of unknown function (DUF6506)